MKEVWCLAQLPQKLIWMNRKGLSMCEPPLGPLMEATLKSAKSRQVEQYILVLEMEEINEGTSMYTYLYGMVYTHLLSAYVFW